MANRLSMEGRAQYLHAPFLEKLTMYKYINLWKGLKIFPREYSLNALRSDKF